MHLDATSRVMWMRPSSLRGGSEDAQFDGIEGISGVAACHVCKEVEGVFIYPGFIVSHSFCFVVDCAKDEFFDFGDLQGFQFEDDGTGD